MLKTIIFDNGNVLIEDAWLMYVDNLVHSLGKTRDEILELILPVEQRFCVGEIDFETGMSELIRATGETEAIKILYQKFPIKPEMISLLLELRNDYQLVLLSNDRGDYQEKNTLWKMDKYFGDNIFLSSQVGLRKPDQDIYNFVLEKINLEPKETVFIDDSEKNLAPARTLGIKTIFFTSPAQCKNELQLLIGAEIA